MSILAMATKPKLTAPIITIVGGAGSGKSTLAATFPNPIFIQAEKADTVFQSYTADEAPTFLPQLPKNPKEALTATLRELYSTEHDYKTVVIDTVTALNILFEKEIADKDNVDTVANAAGGFHKGYQVLKDWHDNVRIMCEKLAQDKGMTIIFLAHSGTEKMKKDPSETSEYTVHTLNMHPDSAKVYINNSDAVLYIDQPKMIVGAKTDNKGNQTSTGRAVTGRERVIITESGGLSGYGYAKNRFDMPQKIELEYRKNPLMQYIKFFNTTTEE